MTTFTPGRFGLNMSIAAILLAGCGGTSMPIRAADGGAGTADVTKGSKTFSYTGKEQTFTVPSGVRRLTVVALGAEGAGGGTSPSSDTPGFPGRVYAQIPVHPAERLYVFVGGSGPHGGFNGGGAGGAFGHGGAKAFNGGGASDVRRDGDALTDRIIVAAGGGGAGGHTSAFGFVWGGNGGGLTGDPGGSEGYYNSGEGGTGATQIAGGYGGTGGLGSHKSGDGLPGAHGLLGEGGGGGAGGRGGPYASGAGGGGGGGGYFGGGGGGGAGASKQNYPRSQGGGGGGGSSYVESYAFTHQMWTGWKRGRTADGLVVFSWK
jgi:hypothetical protein